MTKSNVQRYTNEPRNQIRIAVANLLTNGLDMRKKRVLFMPANIGAEIDIYRSMGVLDANMVMVDYAKKNLDKVCKKFKVNGAVTLGTSLGKAAVALKAMDPSFEIDVLDADLCTNANEKKVYGEIWPFIEHDLLADKLRVRLTYFRGHETNAASFAMTKAFGRENMLKALFVANGWRVESEANYPYTNGNGRKKAPMGVLILHLSRRKCPLFRLMPDPQRVKQPKVAIAKTPINSIARLTEGVSPGKMAAITKMVKGYLKGAKSPKTMMSQTKTYARVDGADRSAFLICLNKGLSPVEAAMKVRQNYRGSRKNAALPFYERRKKDVHFAKAWENMIA